MTTLNATHGKSLICTLTLIAAATAVLSTAKVHAETAAGFGDESDNQAEAANTNLELRKLNATIRAYMDVKRPTPQQWREIVRDSLPKRMTSVEYQPARGKVYWPSVLCDAEFTSLRTDLDNLFAHRGARSGIGSDNYRHVVVDVQQMRDMLRTKINEVSNMEYMAARTFLDRLANEARFAPTDSAVASK